MSDLTATTTEAPSHTKALLQLCKRLERAWSLPDILDAVSPVAEQVLGYPHCWLGVYGLKPGFVSIVLHSSQISDPAFARAIDTTEIPIAGDSMVQEIIAADHVVVVVDARTDPRTNKEIVAALDNRTIINVPLIMAEQRLGAVGMGT
ncbi:GAF domain-containing protein [Acidovorax sp. A1169]|uniref:GAF domain-containing protein n=1 Tax=Acidovorax sp. A1169 TaxID=3059524 RepID=UPI002737AB6A|nr:GAF domain-containing protein [Acidovorax sp. A1169]MDP4074005.1 GAF domain-containing protein [Acidovorax sp. A1169]